MLTQQMEQEFKALISIALSECKQAIEQGDYETAEYFKDQAFELLCKLPENQEFIKLLQ